MKPSCVNELRNLTRSLAFIVFTFGMIMESEAGTTIEEAIEGAANRARHARCEVAWTRTVKILVPEKVWESYSPKRLHGSASKQFLLSSKAKSQIEEGRFRLHNTQLFYPIDSRGNIDISRQPHEQHGDLSFDGKLLYLGSGEEIADPILSIRRPGEVAEGRQSSYLKQQYFYGAGIVLPETEAAMRDVGIISSVEHELRRGGHTVGDASISDNEIVRVGITDGKNKVSSFSLDVHKMYAQVKLEERSLDGKRLLTIDCEDFVSVADGDIWLPKKINEMHYAFEGMPVSTVPLYQVSYFAESIKSSNMGTDGFKLRYKKPGSVVADYSAEDAHQAPTGAVMSIVPQ